LLTFGPVSGAHFNPAVSIAMALRRKILAHHGPYIAAQMLCGIVALSPQNWTVFG